MLKISFVFLSLLSLVFCQTQQCCTTSQCQSTAFNWSVLHITARSEETTILAHNVANLTINCIGGQIWDKATGHPKFSLTLTAVATMQTWDITSRINNTNLSFQANATTDWQITFTNHNSLWNADFDLVFDTGCTPRDLWSEGLSYCTQSCTEWCWATAITMIWNYYKHEAPKCGFEECQIVSAQAQHDCCTNGNPICASPCNIPIFDAYIVEFLQKVEPSYYEVHSVIEPKHLYTSLQQGHPLVVGITWATGGSHVIVIGGVQCPSDPTAAPLFLVGDPWYGQQKLTYPQIVNYTPNGTSGTWISTVLSDA